MKTLIMSLIAVASFQFSFAQEKKSTTVAPTYTAIEQEVIQLSKQKWLCK